MLKEYNFEKIYIRHAIDESPKDEHFTMHIHDLCEIYLFVSGDVDYLVEGSVYPLEENSIMIMRPSEVHKAKINSSLKYERYAINFPLNFLSELDPKSKLAKAFTNRALGQNNLIDSSVIDMDLIKALCSQMFGDYSDEYDRQMAIKSRLFLILDMISQAFDRQEKEEHKTHSIAERILAYVNNHLFDPISVPELAKHFYLSNSHFNRTFRQATGASPWEYIIKKRLTAAKEKIHKGSPAASACESCGFKDYSSFYRAYTKYFGMAPTSDIYKS